MTEWAGTPSAAPGWYPDAADPSVVRWWDGAQWTEHTQAHPGNQPGSGFAQPGTGFGQQPGGYGYGQQPGGYASPGFTAYPGPPQYQPGTPFGASSARPPLPSAGARPAARRKGSFTAANSITLLTLAVCVGYAVIASAAHIVFFGFLPAALTFRAASRREPLWILALLATIGTVIYAFTTLSAT